MLGFGPPADRRARPEWWRCQIRRQQDGSLSIAEFCRRLGLSTGVGVGLENRLVSASSSPFPGHSRGVPGPSGRSTLNPAWILTQKSHFLF
jgi:hypothetical protein